MKGDGTIDPWEDQTDAQIFMSMRGIVEQELNHDEWKQGVLFSLIDEIEDRMRQLKTGCGVDLGPAKRISKAMLRLDAAVSETQRIARNLASDDNRG